MDDNQTNLPTQVEKDDNDVSLQILQELKKLNERNDKKMLSVPSIRD